jgi:L-aminopeptidase/D-esterase-like protein
MQYAMKGGEGSSSARLPGDVVVGALAVVNAFGDVVDPGTGDIVAGARNPSGDPPFVDTYTLLRERAEMGSLTFARQDGDTNPGTVLGVVAVNAELNKEEINIVARMSIAGLARTIRPAFTLLDGDTVFAAATDGPRMDVSTLGAVGAQVLGEAVLRAVREARSAGGVPARSDMMRGDS